jgi:hypothetical protein
MIVAALCLGLGAFAGARADNPRAMSGGVCPDSSCTANGTRLTGIQAADLDRIPIASARVVASAKQAALRASSRGCPEWNCTTNGTQLTGIVLATAIGGSITANETAVVTSRRAPASQGKSGGGGGCPTWMCTVNGTRLTGTQVANLDRISLASALVVASAKQAAFSAPGGGCPDWSCSTNGTQLTGIVFATAIGDNIAANDTAVVTSRRAPASRGKSGAGRSCPDWQCTTNGTQLNGVAPPGIGLHDFNSKEPEVMLMRCASEWVPGCPR